jgi:hypothetical protein
VRQNVERPTFAAVYIEVMYSPLDSYVVGLEVKKMKRNWKILYMKNMKCEESGCIYTIS